MNKLMDDFEIEVVHAAAILGNIGTECAGFHQLREINPVRPPGATDGSSGRDSAAGSSWLGASRRG
jgi:hypothetical protein